MHFYTLKEVEEDIAGVIRKDFDFRNERGVEVVFTKLFSDFISNEFDESDFGRQMAEYISSHSLPIPDVGPSSNALFTIYQQNHNTGPISKLADCENKNEFLKTMQTIENSTRIVVLFNGGRVAKFRRKLQ